MQYAKLNSDKTHVIDWLEFEILPPHKAGYILPVEVEPIPEYNQETEYLSEGEPIIEGTKVIKTWLVNPIVIQVPTEIPLWAFRISIRKNGLKESVEGLLNSLPEPQKSDALDHYEYGNFIVRSHPFIAVFSQMLNLTEKQVDDIFITGSLLI